MPQQPIPEGSVWGEDFAPLVVASFPYPTRAAIFAGPLPFLGALYLLLENRVVRARIVLALCGMAAGRTYMGHWT